MRSDPKQKKKAAQANLTQSPPFKNKLGTYAGQPFFKCKSWLSESRWFKPLSFKGA
jgi:hypothetical protein